MFKNGISIPPKQQPKNGAPIFPVRANKIPIIVPFIKLHRLSRLADFMPNKLRNI